MKHRYIIIGGNPITIYTGTTTFTSLKIVGRTNSLKEVDKIIRNKYDECAGLICSIDMETGEMVDG